MLIYILARAQWPSRCWTLLYWLLYGPTYSLSLQASIEQVAGECACVCVRYMLLLLYIIIICRAAAAAASSRFLQNMCRSCDCEAGGVLTFVVMPHRRAEMRRWSCGREPFSERGRRAQKLELGAELMHFGVLDMSAGRPRAAAG